jgi:hypothetical protein
MNPIGACRTHGPRSMRRAPRSPPDIPVMETRYPCQRIHPPHPRSFRGLRCRDPRDGPRARRDDTRRPVQPTRSWHESRKGRLGRRERLGVRPAASPVGPSWARPHWALVGPSPAEGSIRSPFSDETPTEPLPRCPAPTEHPIRSMGKPNAFVGSGGVIARAAPPTPRVSDPVRRHRHGGRSNGVDKVIMAAGTRSRLERCKRGRSTRCPPTRERIG